jgi:glutamate N-acetyltransferase/amino-acid N-acetyltransferase
MTTDTRPKVLSLPVAGTTLSAIGKGAGMIAPNLATMLVFIFTDADLDGLGLHSRLGQAATGSFQCLSVDTDTSTSDTVVLMGNGMAGRVPPDLFQEGLNAICRRMAELVARDGEGATKLLRVTVEGAASDEEARRVARSIVDSPLVKTMAFGADPNVGRVLMAIGKCVDCQIVPARVSALIQGVEVIRAGVRADFEDSHVRVLLQRDPVDIRVALEVGEGRGIALGCDLTEGYIRENAAYASS